MIRPAHRSDQAAVGALWQRLMTEHEAFDARFVLSDDALERWHNDFPHWVHDDARRVFVAESDSEIVGFVIAQRWSPPPIHPAELEVYIDQIYLAPEARGQGAGRDLVDAVSTWAQKIGATRLRLAVLAANADGRAFWEKLHAQPLALTLTIDLPHPEPIEETTKKSRLGF